MGGGGAYGYTCTCICIRIPTDLIFSSRQPCTPCLQACTRAPGTHGRNNGTHNRRVAVARAKERCKNPAQKQQTPAAPMHMSMPSQTAVVLGDKNMQSMQKYKPLRGCHPAKTNPRQGGAKPCHWTGPSHQVHGPEAASIWFLNTRSGQTAPLHDMCMHWPTSHTRMCECACAHATPKSIGVLLKLPKKCFSTQLNSTPQLSQQSPSVDPSLFRAPCVRLQVNIHHKTITKGGPLLPALFGTLWWPAMCCGPPPGEKTATLGAPCCAGSLGPVPWCHGANARSRSPQKSVACGPGRARVAQYRSRCNTLRPPQGPIARPWPHGR